MRLVHRILVSNGGTISQELDERTCPHCGCDRVDFIQRGYAGMTDTPNQYISCRECGRTTYEIISCTGRDMRIERIEPGRSFKYKGAEYKVLRILKVGMDESLVYVKPENSKFSAW